MAGKCCKPCVRGIGMPVLFLTARDQVEDRVKGLELGADDYLVKPFLVCRIAGGFDHPAARPRRQREHHAASGRPGTGFAAPRVSRNGKRIDLTAKEFGLLELLMRRHGEVLPRSLIASQVWDMNFDSDTNVIEVAMRRLRMKIDEGQPLKLIQTVRGMGYVLDVPERKNAGGVETRLGKLSLTRRLTLFFTVVAAAVVLGLGGLFWWKLSSISSNWTGWLCRKSGI